MDEFLAQWKPFEGPNIPQLPELVGLVAFCWFLFAQGAKGFFLGNPRAYAGPFKGNPESLPVVAKVGAGHFVVVSGIMKCNWPLYVGPSPKNLNKKIRAETVYLPEKALNLLNPSGP